MVYRAYSGIRAELPSGTFGLLKPRSGASVNNGLNVLAGVVDESYRGEIITVFTIVDNMRVKKGDRISQMVVCKYVDEVASEDKDLSHTKRGGKGFGSSGK